MHSEKCPVCNGKGKIKKELISISSWITCHGCNGKGWVEVQDSVYPPYVPVPYVDPFPQPYMPNTCVQKEFPQWWFNTCY